MLGLGLCLAIGKKAAAGAAPPAAIILSANRDVQGATQGTVIGIISGGTGPYTVIDATNQTQVNADGVTLEDGPVAPTVGSKTIIIHDTGTPAAADTSFTISTVPQAVTVTLDTGQDSGSSPTDTITNINTPSLKLSFGTLEIAGDSVDINIDGTVYTKTLASGDISGSSASIGFAGLGLPNLSDGPHIIKAQHTRGGLTGAYGPALSITVDTTAPSLSSATGTKTGSTTADLSAATNTTSGTMDWFVDTTSTAPADSSAWATRAAAAPAKASGAAVSTSPFTASATGLTAGTTYYAYFRQTDVAGNVSSYAGSASFTTDAAASFSLADLNLDGWWSAASSTVSNSGSPSYSITSMTDASGHGNTLTTSGTAPTFDPSKTQNSKTIVSFAGSLGRLFTSAAFALSGTAGNKKNASIIWIGKCSTYTSAPRAVGFNVSGSDNGTTGACLLYHPDATEMKVQTGGGATKADTGTGAVVANTMAVVIATFDGVNSKIYVNGVLKSTVATTTTFADSFTSLDIGSSPNGGNTLNGGFAEVGVVGRVLTSTEIANIQTWAHDAANWAI